MSDVNQALKDQIAAGKIKFDPPESTRSRLRKELLRENDGTKVTTILQALVLELSKLVDPHIRISSLVRNSGHHGDGRAADVANEEVAGQLLPQVATDAKVGELKIDELIFDAGTPDRNKWNYDQGSKHNYDNSTLEDHRDHIHFSVKE